MKLLILAVLLTLAFSIEEETEAMKTLSKIENSKFGQTILDTIQLQLEAGDPVQDLIHLLQGIADEQNQEQKDDDVYIEELQEECDSEISRLQDEITAAKERAAELKAELDEKIPIRDSKVRQLKDKNEFLNLIVQKIVDIDQQKLLKDQEWVEEQEQHDRAQYVIEKVKTIIEDSVQSRSFLEKNAKLPAEVFVQVSDHINNQLKKANFKRKSWNAIFSLLSSVASSAPVQADQNTVKKITDICNNLLDKISESREIERKDYNHWVDEYSNSRNGLIDRQNETQQQIDQLEGEIATLNKRISNAQYEKEEQEQRAIQKQTQYNDKLKFCDDENISYADRRETRDDDREVVSDCIGLMQSQLRLFRQYVGNRLSNVTKAK